jgi:hypothetical protein
MRQGSDSVIALIRNGRSDAICLFLYFFFIPVNTFEAKIISKLNARLEFYLYFSLISILLSTRSPSDTTITVTHNYYLCPSNKEIA